MAYDHTDKNLKIKRRAALIKRSYLRSSEADCYLEDVVPSYYNIQTRLSEGGCLLFNSVSRALVVLSGDETAMYDAIIAGQTSHYTDDQLNDLKKNLMSDGYFVSSELDEAKQVRETYLEGRHNQNTMVLTIAPTMACNFACGYCFQGLDKDLKKIGKDVPDGIYDFVASHADQLSDLDVCWYGGEPLMSAEAIYELSDRLIALCDKKGINYTSSIVTNGYFLDVKTSQKLWSRRCTSAQITIDGNKEKHDQARPLLSGRGTYDKILENIDHVLDETPLGIQVRVNVGRDNLDSCTEMLEEFVDKNYAQRGDFMVYFAPLEASTAESGTAFETGLSKQDFNQAVLGLQERARQAGLTGTITPPEGIMGLCIAARDLGYLITANGDVHKCWETAHDPTKRIGTVFKPEKLSGTLNAKLWEQWEPFDNEVCRACKIAPMCGGFCAHRFVYNGAGDEQSLPCPDWKWNTAEYLFSRAVSQGVIDKDRWLPEESTALAEQSGKRHTDGTLRVAQTTLLDKVNAGRSHPIDRDYLLQGDGRFFEDEALGDLKPRRARSVPEKTA